MPNFLLEFKDVDREHSAEVGEKAANLGELVQSGFPVPPGFIISPRAYTEFIEQNNIKRALIGATYARRQKLISESFFPETLKKEIIKRYEDLGSLFEQAHIVVRPSPVSDKPTDYATAGLASVLNVRGEANLLAEIKNIWARAKTAIIVQKLIDAEVAGVAFTVSPTNKHQMLIEAVWGLGEFATGGHVTPDKYLVERHLLKIEEVSTETQDHQLTLSGHTTKTKRVPSHRHKKQKLSEKQILELARILQKVQSHYFFPQNVEWAYAKGNFYILHVRPMIITSAQETVRSAEETPETLPNVVLFKGEGASPGIVTGVVRIIKEAKHVKEAKKGEIVVFKKLTPDMNSLFKRASAVITDHGGITSHAAIMTRELGIPCVVGTLIATSRLRNGQVVTINGKTGEVFAGKPQKVVKVEKVDEVESQAGLTTSTKIYLNLAEPEKAKTLAKLPVDGVGLFRSEFVISEIGVHPRHIIAQGRQEFFVEKLAKSIEEVAGTFETKPVIYRTCDFKSNEYKKLQGGKTYEPDEENPLLGFRGAARYIADPEVFELELAAIKKAREKYKDINVMIPYVRTPQELLEVKRIMASTGLVRSNNFKIWMMVELPANVLLIEDFLNIGIDGISFGTNDLNALLYGYDRDNGEVAKDHTGATPALLASFKKVIKACKKMGVTTSICGEAASAYDTLVESLVELGITSISVNPDALGRVQKVVHETERRL